jgi:transcription elongation GreA/GreB family factor
MKKYILKEDVALVRQRLQEIDRELFALGAEFHEAVHQSSETWHDNAPFDVVRDKQTILNAERAELTEIVRTHTVTCPKSTKVVGIGSRVKCSHIESVLLIAGHFTMRHTDVTVRVISVSSPLGSVLVGARSGDTREIGNNRFNVEVL